MKEKKKDHLSFSSLNRFEKCEFDGYVHFTSDGESNTTAAMRAGKLFHKTIELAGLDTEIESWIAGKNDFTKYYKKDGKLYADYQLAVNCAKYLLESGLYHSLDVRTHPFDYPIEPLEDMALVEVKAEGEISKVPMLGYIDLLEDKEDEINIHDWKFIKDYKKVYNESARKYDEWYESYIDQQMIYAYLVHQSGKDSHKKDRSINCEIVGVTKVAIPAIKQIQFHFNNIDEMMDTVRWKLLTARMRYAWKKLNETTDETMDELQHCGVCDSCRSHNIVVRETLEIE